MAKKPHVRLNSAVQRNQVISMKFNYGPLGDENEANEVDEPDYRPMADVFRQSLDRLNLDISTRRSERNSALQIPVHIDFIHIEFQDQFIVSKFYSRWYSDFGLEGVNFSKFNREGLFAVIDRSKFQTFLGSIEAFIQREVDRDYNLNYDSKVKFIKNFQLLTTQEILQFEGEGRLLNFRMVDFPLEVRTKIQVYVRLTQYLSEREIRHRLIADANILEVYEVQEEVVREIAQNFDIFLSVTSALSTVVRPTAFNLPERGYGFQIADPEDDLPIIGILDTGISNLTPLSGLLINDNTFDLTGTSPFSDNCDHGTAVSALAALGRVPYSADFRGTFQPDARLLSMKILDEEQGNISIQDVLGMLNRAKQTYPEMRLFTLTTCYKHHKKTNEDYSAYAYELDKFAHENGCLIFVCTSNNDEKALNQPGYSLGYFSQEETNLCCPAETMNNVVVGGAAGNLKEGAFLGISPGKEFPTLYSRKCHIDLEEFKKIKKNNRNLFKPDIIDFAGDYEGAGPIFGMGERATMEVLSADPAFGFRKLAGTSFSTPLVANLAAQIQRAYPSLKTQSIKALILNAASLDLIRFDKPVEKLRSKTAGNGITDPLKSLQSSEHSITFIVEEVITPGELKVFPLNFPRYLLEDDLGKENGILKLTATLCFSFQPVLNNQLGYCPLQMAFSIFKNHEPADIIRSEDEKNGGLRSKLKSDLSWSQNNRYKSKPIPSSNSQKISFPINKKELIEENSTFKLAIHCFVTDQLLSGQKEAYMGNHNFSIAIRIEEDLKDSKLTRKLYSEMLAVNEIETISIADLEAEGEA